jgi:membrane-bound serine protease (ClpP class)
MKSEDLLALGVSSGVVKNDADLTQHFGATNVARLDESWSEDLARFMVTWPVRFVLIVVFLIAIFVEMTHPGASVPGLIAVLALGALIAPSMLVGMAAWWEVAAILAGLGMLALELFVVPGFGLFGFAGIVLLFGGLLGVILPSGDRLFPGETGTGGSTFYAAAMMLAAIVTAGVGIYFITKHLGSLPVINKLVLQDDPASGGGLLAAMAPSTNPLVGKAGPALTDLRPAGRAEIDGRIVDVVAELGYIPAGTRVRVVSVSPMRIGVEADADGATGAA